MKKGQEICVNNNYLNYKVKHGRGHVTICGGFEGGKVGYLLKITSAIKKSSYHSILVHHAVPFGIRNTGQGFIFQQDNDPK